MTASSKNGQDDQLLEDAMEQKLRELREELAKGQRHLDLLDQQRQQVRDTLLRISGAIQVLDELLTQPGGNGATAAPAPDRGASSPPKQESLYVQ